MIVLELPMIYLDNFEDVEKGKEQGFDIDPIRKVLPTTFLIPETSFVRINDSSDGETTIRVDEYSCNIKADYETVRSIINKELEMNRFG
jgi:hypothetical protein